MSPEQIQGIAQNMSYNLSFGAAQPLLALAGYILSALALYTMAERRGIHHPWLAWIPVANLWIWGSLSDQYRYVVMGQYTSRRKSLLILRAFSFVLGTAEVILGSVIFVSMFAMGFNMADADTLIPLVIAALGLLLPLIGVAIAGYVIRCIALHDIFKSADPSNATAFLVISIVIGMFVNVIPAVLLFVCRNKDAGMPPRVDQQVPPPVYGTEYPPM